MKIGFIGYGNMASAIAKALVCFGGISKEDLGACARDFIKLKQNTEELGIKAYQSVDELITNSDFIVMAVKPYQVEEILHTQKERLRGKVLVSVAAGIYFDDYEAMLDESTHHISTIPNTPIVTGKGILICERKHSLNKEELAFFEELFSKVTMLEYVDSEHFSIAGTIAGCTPAFTAMYLEALGDAGVKYGLGREMSYRLVAKMLEGTGALYLAEGKHPGQMKDAVCSPGGTTIKGVSSLEESGLRGSLIKAIDAIEGK